MQFNLSRLSAARQKATTCFLQQQGHEIGTSGIQIEMVAIQENLLKAELQGDVLRLSARKETHYYRALHLFLQRIANDIPFTQPIVEHAAFEHAGLMLDVSRNGTMQLSLLEEFVRHCAATGMDRIFLYMEDVYEIPQVPSFGAYRGKYRIADLKKLDDYAAEFGVEIIPTIQTLAHLRTFLRWSCNDALRDTEDILLVDSAETETFLRQMIHSIATAFRSKQIHVGMDEADFLGLGRYLHQNGYHTHADLMTKHLALVQEICASEGKSVMMWSDMFLRMASPTGSYYDVPEGAEFSLPQPLDAQIGLVYWDYYHHAQSIYEKNIRLHKKLTQRVQFAGGGWTWNGIAPNYSKAQKTLQEGLAACKAQQIQEVMCTFWLDNGAETPMRTIFYSATYFAQLCFHSRVDLQPFAWWIAQQTGYPCEAHLLLDAFDATMGTQPDNQNADNPSKFLLYQDVLLGLFDRQLAQTQTDMNAYYADLAEQLAQVLAHAPAANAMRAVFEYYHVLAQVLSHKAMFGINITEAYQQDDRAQLQALCKELRDCAALLDMLKEKRAALWFAECRPFGFEVLDIRLGGVHTRLCSAEQRIQQYLKGTLPTIPELEEERILFCQDTQDEKHLLCASGFWEKIISGANIVGV